MFGTSDLSTLMRCLRVQVAAAASHQKRFIELFILSVRPKVNARSLRISFYVK